MDKIFEGLEERYEHFLLYEPLYQLKYGKKYKNLDTFELGISVLLYFLEEMLSGRKVTGESIEAFLNELLTTKYNVSLSKDEIRELRIYIVDEKLRNNGKDFTYTQFDISATKQLKINFKLITRELKGDTSFLKLTDKGIELLFKTREMYSEVRISFTMLYFKQQLLKNNFSSSLNLARTLNFEIMNEIENIEFQISKVRSNVLSTFAIDEYRERINRTKHIFENVREQFNELNELVESIKSHYVAGQLSKKERESFSKVREIEELIRKSNSNTNIWLFNRSELMGAIDVSLEKVILNLSSRSYNFEENVLNEWVTKQIVSEKASMLIRPLLPINLSKEYNPIRAFLPQKIQKEREITSHTIELLTDEDVVASEIADKLCHEENFTKYVAFTKMLLKPFSYKEQYFFSETLKQLKKESPEDYVELLNSESHFKALMFLCGLFHGKNSPIPLEIVPTEEFVAGLVDLPQIISSVVEVSPNLTEVGSFLIFGTDKVLDLENGYSVTDFVITKGE